MSRRLSIGAFVDGRAAEIGDEEDGCRGVCGEAVTGAFVDGLAAWPHKVGEVAREES